jgi:hypothetical protein
MISRQHTVWCDSKGCSEWFQYTGGVNKTRSMAERKGWATFETEDRKFDFCKSCHAKILADQTIFLKLVS